MATLAELNVYSTEDLLDGYSDCYKSLHNVRPHGTPTREALIHFWMTYDERFADAQAEEEFLDRRELAFQEKKHGRKFASMDQYYDFMEQNY